MLDLKFVRDHIEPVRRMLHDRQVDLDLESFLGLDEERRQILREVEALKRRRNLASDGIAQMKQARHDATSQSEEMREVSQRIKNLDQQLAAVQEKLDEILLLIPNMPHPRWQWERMSMTIQWSRYGSASGIRLPTQTPLGWWRKVWGSSILSGRRG